MRTFILFLSFGFVSFLCAEKKVLGSFYWGGTQFKNSQKWQSLSKQQEQMDGGALAALMWQEQTLDYTYNIQLFFVKRFEGEQKEDFLYLGTNAYLQIFFSRFSLLAGRVQSNQYPQQIHWKDGGEGLQVLSQFSSLELRIQLFDYYRGYPLWENFQYSSEEVRRSKTGKRFRNAFSVIQKNGFGVWSFFFTYLNSYDWGSFSQDLPDQNNGDRDYLYHGRLRYQVEFSYWQFGVAFTFARGLDKIAQNPFSPEKSLPISGEMADIFLQYTRNHYWFSLFLFLPDSDKRNREGQVLELGYVGMGSIPYRTKGLAQAYNFYPAAWVTHRGLEKQDSLFLARRNSFWANSQLALQGSMWQLVFSYNYILPRIRKRESSGGIETDKKFYEKQFLAEAGLAFHWQKTENYSLLVEYSFFYSNQSSFLRGQFVEVAMQASF
ncbi:MAG: hypothetical protein AAF518_05480 [Spirochaetota bacterium]